LVGGAGALRQFRGRALYRRGQYLDQFRAALPRPADRGGHGRALLQQLRADPRRRRHADQPAERRSEDRGLCVAGAGLLMADDQPVEAIPPPRPRRAWDGRWQRWATAILAALLLIVVGALAWLDTSSGH